MLTKFIEVSTYNELQRYVIAFRKKYMGLLIVVSRAGLGKSYLVEQTLETEVPLMLNSHITPLKFYSMLYEKTKEEEDCLVIIDEAEMMFQNPKLKTMLKILCDTRIEKLIKYDSNTTLMRSYPKEFYTQAKVVLLLNTLNPSDEHIKAIMSRGHLVYFNPTDMEVLKYMKTWAEDREILNFINDFAPLSKSLNLRTYVKAEESKRSELNWKGEIISELELDNRFLVIKNLLNKYKNDIDRINEWKTLTKNDRTSFYRYKKLFLSKGGTK